MRTPMAERPCGSPRRRGERGEIRGEGTRKAKPNAEAAEERGAGASGRARAGED
jgi:hypothetical protein